MSQTEPKHSLWTSMSHFLSINRRKASTQPESINRSLSLKTLMLFESDLKVCHVWPKLNQGLSGLKIGSFDCVFLLNRWNPVVRISVVKQENTAIWPQEGADWTWWQCAASSSHAGRYSNVAIPNFSLELPRYTYNADTALGLDRYVMLEPRNPSGPRGHQNCDHLWQGCGFLTASASLQKSETVKSTHLRRRRMRMDKRSDARRSSSSPLCVSISSLRTSRPLLAIMSSAQ